MSNAWQSAYNVHLIKGNIITTVVNTNRPTLFSMTAVLQSLSYWETQNQQYSDKDICPYVFAYFVQVYLESKCLEVQRLCVFSIWQILLNCPSKMATSIYTCTHGSTVKIAQTIKSNVKAAATGCFPATDAFQRLLCLSMGHWEHCFKTMNWYFETNTLQGPSENLYIVGVLPYICSRHLAS